MEEKQSRSDEEFFSIFKINEMHLFFEAWQLQAHSTEILNHYTNEREGKFVGSMHFEFNDEAYYSKVTFYKKENDWENLHIKLWGDRYFMIDCDLASIIRRGKEQKEYSVLDIRNYECDAFTALVQFARGLLGKDNFGYYVEFNCQSGRINFQATDEINKQITITFTPGYPDDSMLPEYWCEL